MISTLLQYCFLCLTGAIIIFLCNLQITNHYVFLYYQLDLRSFPDQTQDVMDFEEHHEWLVGNVSVERHDKKYPCCEETYTDITYYLHIKRNSLFYQYLFLAPSVLFVLLVTAIFLLPTDRGEKITLGNSLLILTFIYFAANLDPTGQ